MFKYKQLVIGIVIGLLFIPISGFAAAKLNIIANPYPVIIDGVKTKVDGYSINGSTYLKLTDFKKAGLTVKFNETDKQIEITSVVSYTAAPQAKTESLTGSTSTMSAATITYDETTGLPVGATYTEYKGCKTAVLYNGNIYLTKGDLNHIFGIRYKSTNVQNETTMFGDSSKDIVINLNDINSIFFNSSGAELLNVALFKEIIGE